VSLVPDERLAQRVGGLALVAIAAAIAGFVFLDRASLGSPTRIRVVFHHVAGLRVQAPLVVAGQPVGRIEAITPVPHGAPGPLAGEVGVAVTIAVDRGSAWKVPAAAAIFVASRGPLSDRYLEVAPPAGAPGAAIHDGQELRGVDPPSLDNVLQRAWVNMTTYKLFVDAIRPELEALVAQLAALRRQLAALAEPGVATLLPELRALTTAARHTYDSSLGGEAGVASVRAAIDDARTMIGQIRGAADVLSASATAVAGDLERVRGQLATSDPIARADHTLAAIRAALDKIDPLLATLAELAERIANGEGSLGRLMTDPEFSDDAKDLGKIMKRHPWRIIARPHD